MSFVKKEDEGHSEAEVTAADQADINMFSRLNNRFHDLEDEIKIKNEEMNNVKDAIDELMMVMDDEAPVKYSIGECFVELPKDEAEQRLDEQAKAVEADMRRIEEEMESIKKKMRDLKSKLYGKFGKAINLEED